MTGQRVFLVEEPFAAEPAADIGRDDANPVLRKSDRGGQIRAHAVRALSREPNSQISRRFRLRHDASRLHRQRDQSRAGDTQSNDMLGFGECLVYVAACFPCDVAQVAIQLFAGERRAGLQRLFGIHDRGQRFIFHNDGARGILGEGAAFSNHRRHGSAGRVDRAARQQRMGRYLHAGHHRDSRDMQPLAEIIAGHYGDHSGHRLGCACIDGNYFRMRVGTTLERHVEHSR